MPVVVELELHRKKDKILGDVGGFDLTLGSHVIVEIDNALEIAIVAKHEVMIDKPKQPVYKILRSVTPEDKLHMKENEEKNREACKTVLDRIRVYNLNLKLTCVEYSFDRTKLYIYYTSETRVDFRQLVKDLGHLLKARIQMVQIGGRDESKMLGGLGLCGRLLCCMTFLKEFTPISVEMAKEQNLSINIAKLSGLCGRLKCCLAYEYNYYAELSKKMPPVGSKVTTPEGLGNVVGIDYLKRSISVELSNKQIKQFSYEQVSVSFLDRIIPK